MQMDLSRHIAADPDVVWDVLTDIPGAPRTLSGVISVEILTNKPYEPGLRWRETRKMFGSKATEEMMVVVAEPPAARGRRIAAAGRLLRGDRARPRGLARGHGADVRARRPLHPQEHGAGPRAHRDRGRAPFRLSRRPGGGPRRFSGSAAQWFSGTGRRPRAR